jgi:alpha-methylacyl-CoA racemase
VIKNEQDKQNHMRPLENIRVLDFSTRLPGPFASLMLAEAGAQVVKIERPGRGDEMRSYAPKFGDE